MVTGAAKNTSVNGDDAIYSLSPTCHGHTCDNGNHRSISYRVNAANRLLQLKIFEPINKAYFVTFTISIYNTFLTIVKTGFVYITSNRNRTTLYVGVTSDINNRIYQHKFAEGSKFTSKYNCFDLLYFEAISGMMNAINREKQLKRWHREWKWNLIKKENPELRDLAEDWFEDSLDDYGYLLRC